MAALVWLFIPLFASLLAALWGSWATRRRSGVGGGRDASGVRSHEAFRAAMERPARTGERPATAPAPTPAPLTSPAPADG
ncbi:hypothetical protein [Streptomyces lonarensis]|uniref:Uncharacterized protein n=1 Tax=Streptomyces lonarensis TaxID=700599 RepID=A0A7X6CXJ8_9ACTN|nr:hypothetical protein [Streptomyces lonarensis]NJQ04383.1 hypothetical protein [Streptomyces lonarensis]